jgi:hypothetical protein
MSSGAVQCSIPDCLKPACQEIRAPWSDGGSTDWKTLGHACVDHASAVIASVQNRLRRSTFGPGQALGEVSAHRDDSRVRS